ncbi:hypothetical protein PMAYCL1PPCAC_18941 [Pristionchus mayeri]|uniref:Glycoside hydrolase family 5 domain-containing protein n=1 Tax=Pristionchus mayeri TaxID=1317129 RepID=A0AAN5CQE4_9BILA|nr:hypothetical protein PMAYCL1PPCAC_18941 [Pristionchus mayeri]
MLISSLLPFSFLIVSIMSEQCVNKLEWTTAGGQIMVNGQPLVLKGINYFGFETETYAPHGIWSYDLNYYLDFIKNNGFNAIRVPFSLEMVKNNPSNFNINCATNPGLCGKSSLQLLDMRAFA